MGVTHAKGKLITTIPRRRAGVPATLSYISTKSPKGTSPSFRAFPDYQTNELHVSKHQANDEFSEKRIPDIVANCSQKAYLMKIALYRCTGHGMMLAADCGLSIRAPWNTVIFCVFCARSVQAFYYIAFLDGTIQVQRPSIWVVDMNTEQRIRRFEIPQSIVQPGHGLASITVDVDQNNCNGAFAYIPDLLTYRLYVYR